MMKTVVQLEPKNRQMLELLVQGASARAVARKMGYSEGTTRVYLHHLYRAIGVKNKTEAVIWYLARRRGEEPARPAPAPVARVNGAAPAADASDASFGDLALREGLLAALGAMASFLGPYGRLWEASLKLKGEVVDEGRMERRARARLLWRALLAGDFPYAKGLHDEGVAERMALESPSEAALLACMLLLGGYSTAGESLAARLTDKRGARPAVTGREMKLLNALRQAARGEEAEALLAAYHLAVEAVGAPAVRQLAMVVLFHLHRARRDAERARATADAIWSEAEATRQQLEAMGVRPLPRDAQLPRPARLREAASREAASREAVTAGQ